jgi:hypothetical protein
MQRKAGLLTRGPAKAGLQSGKCFAGNQKLMRLISLLSKRYLVEDATTNSSMKNWYNEHR